MAEVLTINIVHNEVGVQYRPESLEATFQDEMVAREIGLHALATQAIQQRERNGLPVPPVLRAVVEAQTFHELMRR